MKEIKRSCLTQAVRSKVRSRSRVFWPLAMLLCVISGVMGGSLLFEGNSSVKAAPDAQNGMEKLSLPVRNLPRSPPFGPALAKSGPSEDQLWRAEKPGSIGKSSSDIGAMPEFYRALSLNEIAQRELLRHAPMEFTKAAKQTQVVMTLPMPDGSIARFRVEESPVLAPQLAARFPAIKTYRGRGLDDPTATTRFDVTPAGFHAIVLSTQGTVIIEPAARGQAGKYVSYEQNDAPKDAGSSSCSVFGADQLRGQPASKQLARSSYANLTPTVGTTLRTYRLALAATAEFTQTYGGGTVAGSLNKMTTLINAVNALYERDLGIHFNLIANETSIIFTNTTTDGYTSDNANSMLLQNQANLDRIVGPANYDVGMVLDGRVAQPGRFVFQGAGQYQSACSTLKGRGVSILRSTEPSTDSAIVVVAHELGHMFGALHTFNGTTDDCGPSRFPENAYEPGSGSTVMGNRGGFLPNGTYYPLCGAEGLQPAGVYFHSASIEQIVNFTTFGNGSFCPAITDTGNNPPHVDAGTDYTIPAHTPFVLTATGSDPEADALSYCWEQYDLGAPGPPNTDNGNRPIFRSFGPVATPSRTFPQMSDILSGTSTLGESLPITDRTMTFRITVRDNHPGGGGVNTGAMRVNVSAGSGPFAVTNPASSTTWAAGSNQTVNWDVANTSSFPVSCANVRVLLSIDGGNSFPFTLASSTPNNGTATVSVPNMPSSTARVKVEAIGNIFFNVSLPGFAITPSSTAAPILLTEENTNQAAALDSVSFMRGPFSLDTPYNLSWDQRTRVMLFAVGLELLPDENLSVVTVEVEDSAHRIYPLTIEYLGKIPPPFDWLTQVNVRLPDGLAPGDVWLNVRLRGAASNKVVIRS